MDKVLDKYGNELKAGDSVCFIHKHSMESQYIVKAIVAEVKPMKKDKDFPNLNENRGWVIIDKYVDEHINNSPKAKKKVSADRVVKCYQFGTICVYTIIEHLTNKKMKEFNKWFTISFSFMGKDFEHTIAIKNITIDGDTWYYYFDINVSGDTYTAEVYGTYDDDGNIRTSGECYVDGNEVASAFGINVTEDGDVIDYIDDIDIIDAD